MRVLGGVGSLLGNWLFDLAFYHLDFEKGFCFIRVWELLLGWLGQLVGVPTLKIYQR